MRTYTTSQGDMFDMIALRELGDEHLSFRIMEENYDYHRVRIFSGGIVLAIPEVEVIRRIELVPWKDAVVLPP
jgi:hypothetical protein